MATLLLQLTQDENKTPLTVFPSRRLEHLTATQLQGCAGAGHAPCQASDQDGLPPGASLLPSSPSVAHSPQGVPVIFKGKSHQAFYAQDPEMLSHIAQGPTVAPKAPSSSAYHPTLHSPLVHPLPTPQSGHTRRLVSPPSCPRSCTVGALWDWKALLPLSLLATWLRSLQASSLGQMSPAHGDLPRLPSLHSPPALPIPCRATEVFCFVFLEGCFFFLMPPIIFSPLDNLLIGLAACLR